MVILLALSLIFRHSCDHKPEQRNFKANLAVVFSGASIQKILTFSEVFVILHSFLFLALYFEMGLHSNVSDIASS